MNRYYHSIGDYRRDTLHLTYLEHGIYRALLDTYYLSERPLCEDHAKLMRSHSIRNAEEKQALENILSDFFYLTKDGYRHRRCDVEIEAIYEKSEKARASASKRWSGRVCDRIENASTSQSDGNATHNPLPITKEGKPFVRSSISRFPEFWELYPTSQRKVAKAEVLKKWKARNLDAEADKILDHIRAMKSTKQWQDGFEPAPLTYINQSRWLDEVVPNGHQEKANGKPWFLSASGIQEKAVELGIIQVKNEAFPTFKDRIYKAAGITAEIHRKAMLDFGGTP